MSAPGQSWHWGDGLRRLADCLDAGGLLAIPTESSYGLAVDPLLATGVDRLFQLKGRSATKALPVVLAEVAQLERLGGDPAAPNLVELAALWPAPLTVVVPLRQPIPASGGSRSLAVRVPAHDRLRSLLQGLDRPLTATSANLAGAPPVCDPEQLPRLLDGEHAVIVEDGRLPGGPPSTIVEPIADGYRILRPGALGHAWLQSRVSRPVFSADAAEIPADESGETR